MNELLPGELLPGEQPSDALLPDDLLARARAVLDLARQAKRTIGAAESCTGGLVAAAFISIPGASDSFWGSVVSYDTSVKERLLGVAKQTVLLHTVVSEQCALEMAAGARSVSGVDVAVSVTGVAGPGGGTPESPVGTVWLGIAHPAGSRAVLNSFEGDRDAVRKAATRAALDLVAEALAELPQG